MTDSSQALKCLSTNAFIDEIGFVLPPASMRRVLQLSPEVRHLATAFRYGQVTEAETREFVSRLIKNYRPGQVFPFDITLAALAVAVEHWSHPFAEEYLLDLARVQRSEFRCSFRVARECLKARYALPRTQIRTARYPQETGSRSKNLQAIRVMTPKHPVGKGKVQWMRYPEKSNA